MISAAVDQLRSHVTKTLGPIVREWDEMAGGTKLPFSIVEVAAQPVPDAVTFLTLGLSDCHRHFPSGTPTRQELVFACYSKFAEANVQGLVGTVGLEGAKHHRALARGSVQGPAGPILPGTKLEALYASLPAYFADEFSECNTTSGKTHFIWLVPVSRAEAEFALRHGWSRFEELLVKQDPDLLDLNREDVRLPVMQRVK